MLLLTDILVLCAVIAVLVGEADLAMYAGKPERRRRSESALVEPATLVQ